MHCAQSRLSVCLAAAVLLIGGSRITAADDPWVVYDGEEGLGKGKHVVLVSGDEEYRSEEMLPQLGAILAKRHGFKCTVLFAIHKQSGDIDPNTNDNIPGLEALESADLLILFTRFRRLPDEQLKYIEAYVNAGRPIIGVRTATHAFANLQGPFARWNWNGRGEGFDGGFGRQVLGETWIAHHGAHGSEATRGVIPPGEQNHPIVRGCEDIFGPTDVYRVRLPLPGNSRPVVLGQVVAGMKPDDPPVQGAKNEPMMPLAWTKTYEAPSGKTCRVFTTTMGSSQDFQSEGFRRLMVNATLWAQGMEDKIPERADVELVGEFKVTPFGFNGFRKGVKPADLK
jgi:hypothetical protein